MERTDEAFACSQPQPSFMKTALVCIVAVALPFFTSCRTTPPAKPKEASIEFEITSPHRMMRIGDESKIKLSLFIPEFERLLKQTEGINLEEMEPSAFVYEASFKAQHKGPLTFGPYSITYNGQKIKSNQLVVQVLPEWDGTFGTLFHVDRESINLGEDIELLVETWRETNRTSVIDLKNNEAFSITSRRSSSSLTSQGNSKVFYNRIAWRISPKKAGELVIDKDMFRNIPKDVEFKPIKIQIIDSPEARKAAAARNRAVPKGYEAGSFIFEEETDGF
jgi:hypothetical protein